MLSILLCITFCGLIFFTNDNRWDEFAKPVILGIIGEDLAVSLCTLTLFIYKLHQLIHHGNSPNDSSNGVDRGNEIQNDRIQRGIESDFSVNTATNTITAVLIGNEHRNDHRNDRHKEDRDPQEMTVATNTMSATAISSLGSLLLGASELGAHQLELIEVITRHTVLGGFAIFFNVMPLVICYFSLDPNWEKSVKFGLVTYGCRLIGMIGMVVSLYLSMKFSNNLYFNCCLLCHWNCFKCCIRCTRKSDPRKAQSVVKQRG